MNLRLDVYHHLQCDEQDPIVKRLDRIIALLNKGIDMNEAQMAALTAEVERSTEVDKAIMTLVDGLAAQIEAAKTDPVALQALANHLRDNNDAIVAKVVANTSAAPAP